MADEREQETDHDDKREQAQHDADNLVERLGHANVSLTLDTYSHVLPSLQDETAERLDALFTPPACADLGEAA